MNVSYTRRQVHAPLRAPRHNPQASGGKAWHYD
jgi:hypothetical protein